MKNTNSFKKVSSLLSLQFLLVSQCAMLSSAMISNADETITAPAVVAPAQPAASTDAATQAAAVATTTQAGAAAPQQGSLLGMAMPFVIMLTVMYFLMIRPQQKKMKTHQALLSGLKNGDEVITNAGIIGTIAGMNDKVVTLEVSKNVQMKVLKSQVNQVISGTIPELTV